MNLLTLNLHAPLEWSAAATMGTVAEALTAADAAPDGAEIVMRWDWSAAFDETGDDGPRASKPFPEPSRMAASRHDPSATPSDDGQSPAERLEPGRYLFAQARIAPSDDGTAHDGSSARLAELVEWFAREAWWTKAAMEGPLVVRLVREDGKTAVQPLRRLV